MSSQAAGLMAHPADRRSRSKRLTTILALGLVLLAALALPSASFAATDGDFTYVSDGTSVTITGCSASPCEANLTIPASIGGLPVTGIVDEAFYNQTSLRTVAIPASVTTIGEYAFGYSGLTSVTFAPGSQLESIGFAAFSSTPDLTSITIPASVTSLGGSAFRHSGLTSVSFEAGSALATIGAGTFQGTSGLTSITIPASVTTIGDYAFFYSGLTSVSFEAGSALATIGDSAFEGTSGLASITIPASVTSIGSSAFQDSGLTSVSFEAGSALATIGAGTFKFDSGLTSITIPASVTTIGAGTFQFDSGLTSITIPASVTSIGSSAFQGSGLTSVSFEAGSALATIGAGTFQGISGLTSITIPASVTSMGDEAFSGASSLARVIFKGNAPTLVGAGVFDGVAAGAKALLVRGVTGYGADATWNGLELQRAFQVDTGSSPVNRGTVVKATDLDLLNRPVFAWQRCSRLDDASSCSAITGSLGANGAWWGTRNADIGQQVRLKAISDGSDWLTGLSGVVGPSNTTYPSLNQGLVGGAPKQGTALHTSFGTWDGYIAGTSTVAFQWQRCSTSAVNSCTTNIGTNSQWYRPVAADVGEYLRVTATLTTNGQTASAGTLVSGQVASNLAGRRAHTAVRHKPSRHKHKSKAH